MGLLHYESFISSYKLFITPVIGEKDSDLLIRRGGNQMFHCGELQISICLYSLRSCPVRSKRRLISDTWDCEVKELRPLQVTRNTGKIYVSKWMRLCGCRHHMFLTDSIWTQQGSVSLESVNLSSSLLPHSMSPSLNTVHTNFLDQPHHAHTRPAEPQEIPTDLWKRGLRGRRAVE